MKIRQLSLEIGSFRLSSCCSGRGRAQSVLWLDVFTQLEALWTFPGPFGSSLDYTLDMSQRETFMSHSRSSDGHAVLMATARVFAVECSGRIFRMFTWL